MWHETSLKWICTPCGWSYCYCTRFTITVLSRGWSYCYCTGLNKSLPTIEQTYDVRNLYLNFPFPLPTNSVERIPLFSLDVASVLNRIPTFRGNVVSLSSRFNIVPTVTRYVSTRLPTDPVSYPRRTELSATLELAQSLILE